MSYESSAMAYAAAVEGQGIAMAQLFLVEDDLREGRLVMPFKKTLDMRRLHLLPADAGAPRGEPFHEDLSPVDAGAVQLR